MEEKSLVDRHLAEAESALAVIDKQRDDLDRRRHDVVAEITFLRELRSKRPNGPIDPPPDPPDPLELDPPIYGSKRSRYEAAIEKLLRETPTMHRRHLLDGLKAQGVLGTERNALGNISNILSTSPKFETTGNGIWQLANIGEPNTKTAG